MNLYRRLFAVVALSACFCSQSWGHEKTDTLTLYNGDHLTGELKTLFGSCLQLCRAAGLPFPDDELRGHMN